MSDKARLAREYRTSLSAYLTSNQAQGLAAIRGMANRMVLAGLPLLEFAALHERIIVGKILPTMSPALRAALVKQAALFFSAALFTPRPAVRGSTQRIVRLNNAAIAMLSQRSIECALENADLKQQVQHFQQVKAELLDSEQKNRNLLEQAVIHARQMRRLSRDVLAAHENERKEISRELHDVIAQTLAGINLRLTSLKQQAGLNGEGIDQKIAYAQRLVSKAVDIVHRYARKLRPVALDDLGLIPALHAYLKTIRARTGLHITLTACPEVEGLHLAKRTVFFRIIQESLTNISRHAQAQNVAVEIACIAGGFLLEVTDDGCSFDPQKVLSSVRRGHLGIIGMRERLAMVRGTFEVLSTQGKGTVVKAMIPGGLGSIAITQNLISGERT